MHPHVPVQRPQAISVASADSPLHAMPLSPPTAATAAAAAVSQPTQPAQPAAGGRYVQVWMTDASAQQATAERTLQQPQPHPPPNLHSPPRFLPPPSPTTSRLPISTPIPLPRVHSPSPASPRSAPSPFAAASRRAQAELASSAAATARDDELARLRLELARRDERERRQHEREEDEEQARREEDAFEEEQLSLREDRLALQARLDHEDARDRASMRAAPKRGSFARDHSHAEPILAASASFSPARFALSDPRDRVASPLRSSPVPAFASLSHAPFRSSTRPSSPAIRVHSPPARHHAASDAAADSLSDQLAQLRLELDSVQRALAMEQSLRASTSQGARERIRELKDLLASRESELDELKLAQATREVAQSLDEEDDGSTQRRSDSMVVALESALAVERQRMADLQAQAAHDSRASTEQLQSERTKRTLIEADASRLESALTERDVALQSALDTAATRESRLQRAFSAMSLQWNTDRADLERRLAEAHETAQGDLIAVQEAQAQLDEKSRELDAASLLAQSLQSELKSHQSEHERLTTALEASLVETANLSAAVPQLQSQMAVLERAAAQQQLDRAEAERLRSALHATTVELQLRTMPSALAHTQSVELEEKLAAERTKVAAYERQLQAFQEEHSQHSAAWTDRINRLQSERDGLAQLREETRGMLRAEEHKRLHAERVLDDYRRSSESAVSSPSNALLSPTPSSLTAIGVEADSPDVPALLAHIDAITAQYNELVARWHALKAKYVKLKREREDARRERAEEESDRETVAVGTDGASSAHASFNGEQLAADVAFLREEMSALQHANRSLQQQLAAAQLRTPVPPPATMRSPRTALLQQRYAKPEEEKYPPAAAGER